MVCGLRNCYIIYKCIITKFLKGKNKESLEWASKLLPSARLTLIIILLSTNKIINNLINAYFIIIIIYYLCIGSF